MAIGNKNKITLYIMFKVTGLPELSMFQKI